MAATFAGPVGAIVNVARSVGVDPVLALATALHESSLNPQAVGDQGTSYGLFQLHRGGELGSLSPQQAFDPWTNARVALSTLAQYASRGRYGSPGELAAAAQRPASPQAYAAAVNALLPRAQAILGGQAWSSPAASPAAGAAAAPSSPAAPAPPLAYINALMSLISRNNQLVGV